MFSDKHNSVYHSTYWQPVLIISTIIGPSLYKIKKNGHM